MSLPPTNASSAPQSAEAGGWQPFTYSLNDKKMKLKGWQKARPIIAGIATGILVGIPTIPLLGVPGIYAGYKTFTYLCKKEKEKAMEARPSNSKSNPELNKNAEKLGRFAVRNDWDRFSDEEKAQTCKLCSEYEKAEYNNQTTKEKKDEFAYNWVKKVGQDIINKERAENEKHEKMRRYKELCSKQAQNLISDEEQNELVGLFSELTPKKAHIDREKILELTLKKGKEIIEQQNKQLKIFKLETERSQASQKLAELVQAVVSNLDLRDNATEEEIENNEKKLLEAFRDNRGKISKLQFITEFNKKAQAKEHKIATTANIGEDLKEIQNENIEVGLPNVGNTCWLNSLLKFLAFSEMGDLISEKCDFMPPYNATPKEIETRVSLRAKIKQILATIRNAQNKGCVVEQQLLGDLLQLIQTSGAMGEIWNRDQKDPQEIFCGILAWLSTPPKYAISNASVTKRKEILTETTQPQAGVLLVTIEEDQKEKNLNIGNIYSKTNFAYDETAAHEIETKQIITQAPDKLVVALQRNYLTTTGYQKKCTKNIDVTFKENSFFTKIDEHEFEGIKQTEDNYGTNKISGTKVKHHCHYRIKGAITHIGGSSGGHYIYVRCHSDGSYTYHSDSLTKTIEKAEAEKYIKSGVLFDLELVKKEEVVDVPNENVEAPQEAPPASPPKKRHWWNVFFSKSAKKAKKIKTESSN